MGAVDTPQPRAAKGKKGHRRPKRRVGIRIDMTPMADVAFLLLIFFMVTTVFRTPQALEINLPPKDIQIPIANTNILTLRVLPDNTMLWNVGEDKPQTVTMAALPPVIKAEHAKNPDKLVVLIKIDKEAEFHNMVDIIDELDLAKMTRFSMAPLTDEDKKEVETL